MRREEWYTDTNNERGDGMYKYETHLHTFPVSKCARASARETVEFYKQSGYDGIFITNHFLDGYINVDPSLPYAERIEFYFSDYEAALEVGKELDFKVFCGVELSYNGTDFLVYGLDKDWYLQHPEIMAMKKGEELALMREHGALVVQAHPFRSWEWLDHIRLYPKHVDGVEIVNASRPDFENEMAALYAEKYGLIPFAGSDNHAAGNAKRLAGVCCEEPVSDMADFIDKAKNGKLQVFVAEKE